MELKSKQVIIQHNTSTVIEVTVEELRKVLARELAQQLGMPPDLPAYLLELTIPLPHCEEYTMEGDGIIKVSWTTRTHSRG